MTNKTRKLHRRKAFKTVRFIQTAGGDGIECRASDLHSEGARLTFDGLAPQGEKDVAIIIHPEVVPVAATRIWQSLNEIGLRFKKPVNFLTKHDSSLTTEPHKVLYRL